MSVLKLLHPLIIKGKQIYPLTSADQVIKADGTKLENENGIDADTLGGQLPDYFASKTEIEAIQNAIDEVQNIATTSQNTANNALELASLPTGLTSTIDGIEYITTSLTVSTEEPPAILANGQLWVVI